MSQEIEKVIPDVMSSEARNIFVGMPSADNPNQTMCLQDAVSAITNAILDLNARIDELERWPALVNELAIATGNVQRSFDTIAQQLRGTTAVAKAIMNGRPTGEAN